MNEKQIRPTWHRSSFDHTMAERLPALLAERLPLTAYRYEMVGEDRCRISVAVTTPGNGQVEAAYADLPRPDADGLFHIDGEAWVFVSFVEGDGLADNRIHCVGDWIFEYFKEHLGEATADIAWDETLLLAWLPLDRWLTEALATPVKGHWLFQRLDTTNWLSRWTHTRRLWMPDSTDVISPDQIGRVCPFETPEGPNAGKVQSIAIGAAVEEGRLVTVDDRPAASLGLAASMIPCLEHDDSFNLLMGANMMRQWLSYADPEPALVQSGNEPAAADFWCGRNLLTAFLPWGGDTFEDGIVLSASGAARLSDDSPVEVGDKLSNRHGLKGVISRIVVDGEMPCLADGTPVEMVVNPLSPRTFKAFGQIREAVLGRIASVQGKAIKAPPFAAPDDDTVQQMLVALKLSTDGMERLHAHAGGDLMPNPVTVGYVYWGRTAHLARPKLRVSVSGADGAQRQAEMEYRILRQIGATETIHGFFNTQAAGREGSDDDGQALVRHVEQGAVEQAGTPSPRFALLQRRLAAAGIGAELIENALHFSLLRSVEAAAPLAPQPWGEDSAEQAVPGQASPMIGGRGTGGETITLAQPTALPWLTEVEIEEIGAFPAQPQALPRFPLPPWTEQTEGEEGQPPMPEFVALADANARLGLLLEDKMPQSLVGQAIELVATRLSAYLDALLTTQDVQFDSRVLFSGRAVLAPGPELRHDQVGLAEEIAWTLFGPLVVREMGGRKAVQDRTPEATGKLDEIMARSWVIVNRTPTTRPTSMLAFHPLRIPEPVIRLAPLACRALDADFDGDQAAVLLPLTEAGQREAGELLSIEGHLRRDPGLLSLFTPRHEAMWGLAQLSLDEVGHRQIERLAEVGHRQIERLAGESVAAPDGYVTWASLTTALRVLLTENGVADALTAVERLTASGFEQARRFGLSIGPFLAAEPAQPPSTGTLADWETYAQQIGERLLVDTDYSTQLGGYVLAIRSGAYGNIESLARLLGAHGLAIDAAERPAIIRHGYQEGLLAGELFVAAAGMRRRLLHIWQEWDRLSNDLPADGSALRFNVLARARRAAQPGIVFANAAAIGEVDRLSDGDSRNFVGL